MRGRHQPGTVIGMARNTHRRMELSVLGVVTAHQGAHGVLHVHVVRRAIGAVHAHGGELDVLEHVQMLVFDAAHQPLLYAFRIIPGVQKPHGEA